MPPDESTAAAAAEPMWTRRDDKFLELLLLNRNVSIHAASRVIGKTPDQMADRCSFLFDEMRHIIEGLNVEMPREWDLEIAATTTAPPAAEEEVAEALAVPAAPPAAAAEDSAAPTAVAGGGDKSPRKLRSRKKKKPAEKWTLEEHGRFLAGLHEYRGRWQEMSREYVPTRTASQIASHYQKYRIREKQRERDECKRKSIHDITEPGSAAAAAVAAVGLEVPRAGASAPGEEDEPWEPVQSNGEPTGEDGFDTAEEFPGADDPGTLLT